MWTWSLFSIPNNEHNGANSTAALASIDRRIASDERSAASDVIMTSQAD